MFTPASLIRLALADLYLHGFENIEYPEVSACADVSCPDLKARIGAAPCLVTAVTTAQLEQKATERRWRSLHQTANHTNGFLIAYVCRDDAEAAAQIMRRACGDSPNAQIWPVDA